MIQCLNAGIYPPQVKVYELSQLSMKFERHLDSEIIDFQVLPFLVFAKTVNNQEICFLDGGQRELYIHVKLIIFFFRLLILGELMSYGQKCLFIYFGVLDAGVRRI